MTGSGIPPDPTTSVIELLGQLIERRSVTPEDDGCQALLADRLEALGFTCESMPFGEVSNLWARRGSGDPLLCFAGHTDVVPSGPQESWQSDPFQASVRDGLLYGRGAADMKGGLAAMVVAVERFLAAGNEICGSLAFLITSDEEGPARDGTLRVLETLTARKERIDWCVIGEPSSKAAVGDRIRVGRRGSLSAVLTVRGVQGHVAYPEFARNPIMDALPVLQELQSKQWDAGNEYFPPTSFQIVRIHSDAGAPNVIPGELTVRFNFRYCTEWHYAALQDEVRNILERHAVDYDIDWKLSGEPFLTRPGRLTKAVVSSIKETNGLVPELSTGGGTSDGRFIAPAGADVVELGPVGESIHQVDEHVAVADLGTLAAMYENVMRRLLT